MKDKSEVFSCFQTFHKMVLNQFDARVKIVRSDNGGEYFFGGLKSYFTDHGIIHQHTCSDTPQQNGVAERKNRHLIEVARALRFSMNVHKLYTGQRLCSRLHISLIECHRESLTSNLLLKYCFHLLLHYRRRSQVIF